MRPELGCCLVKTLITYNLSRPPILVSFKIYSTPPFLPLCFRKTEPVKFDFFYLNLILNLVSPHTLLFSYDVNDLFYCF